MKKFCVFGNPISHSLSPDLHNAAFAAFREILGYRGVYEKFLLDFAAKDSPKILKNAFLSGEFFGANVTAPFKNAALLASDDAHFIAQKTLSANTLTRKNDKIFAHNTDVYGFTASLDPKNLKNALIFGTGGAARSVFFALQNLQIPSIAVCREKNPQNLAFFGENLRTFQDLARENQKFSLIVNATGQNPLKDLPQPIDAALAYDLSYQNTDFLKAARAMNPRISLKNGAEMLVFQAAKSFEIWAADPKITAQKVAQIMQEAYA